MCRIVTNYISSKSILYIYSGVIIQLLICQQSLLNLWLLRILRKMVGILFFVIISFKYCVACLTCGFSSLSPHLLTSVFILLASYILEQFSLLGPSAIDSELMYLDPENNADSLVPLKKFLEMMQMLMKTRKHFQLLQAYVARCLQVCACGRQGVG